MNQYNKKEDRKDYISDYGDGQVCQIPKFEVGDKVEILWEKSNYDKGHYGRYGIIKQHFLDSYIVDNFHPDFSSYMLIFNENELVLSTPEKGEKRTIKMKINTMMKKVLDKDIKTLIKANYLNAQDEN